MTVLALKNSRRANAVSSLHGQVSRTMWTGLWPGRPEDEVPIGHITNGVHVPYLAGAADAAALRPPPRARLERRERRARRSGRGSRTVDDGELWETHQVLKARLIAFVRQPRRPTGRTAAAKPREVIDQLPAGRSRLDALTIGFARRFATYKRANLVFQDLEQMARPDQRSAAARSSSSSPARPTRWTAGQAGDPARSPSSRAIRSSPARSCSSRTTT